MTTTTTERTYRVFCHGTDEQRLPTPLVVAECKTYRQAQLKLEDLLSKTDLILSFC